MTEESAARTDPMRIVRAAREQAEDAVRLIEEYQDAVGVIVRDERSDILHSLDSENKAIWLAYAGTGAVGCIAFRHLTRPAHAGEVKRLYVRSECRGRGVAQQLLLAVEGHAAASGCTSLFLDSKDDLVDAIRFYAGMGYVRCARYNDNPQATVFMRKDFLTAAAQ